MGSLAKKGLQQYLLQLQHHPLRTKVPTYLSCAFVIFSCLSDLWVCLVDGKIRDFGGQYLLGNWVGPFFIIYFSFFPPFSPESNGQCLFLDFMNWVLFF